GGALVVAHGHDDSALLGCQMFVDSRHGGTLQQKVLHLVFENTVPNEVVAQGFCRLAQQRTDKSHRYIEPRDG
ncbi:hypothetical protein, partial [Pseudoduganella aquatica]|uniref:hypothetical protein n=1 Tax=Pseudoduganella aquatica TaxID=2660641 RepID=UPI001CB745BA